MAAVEITDEITSGRVVTFAGAGTIRLSRVFYFKELKAVKALTVHATPKQCAVAGGVWAADAIPAGGILNRAIRTLRPHASRRAGAAGPPVVVAIEGLADVATAANAQSYDGQEMAEVCAAVVWNDLGKDNDEIREARIKRHKANSSERKAAREEGIWRSADAQAATQSAEEEARTFRAIVLALAPSRASIQGGGGGGDVNVAVAGGK